MSVPGGSWGRGASRGRPDDRPRRRADGACSLLGVRPSSPRRTPNVLLAGDAGVGKTRLLTELRDLAVAEGWQVVAGHCLDFGDSALPYLPVLRGARPAGRRAARRWSPRSPTRTPRSPGCSPGRRVMAPTDGRSRRPEADGSSTAATCSRRCTPCSRPPPSARRCSLVVEDCHWADQSTRDLLSFLFSRPFDGAGRGRRVLPLRRPAPPAPAPPPGRRVVAAARRRAGRSSARCADDDVRALVARLHRGPLAEERARPRIVDRAEGNAFFVEELVGAGVRPGGGCPTDLADVLLVRLDRLDDARPPGGAGGQRRRPPGHPRAARGGVRAGRAAELEEALRKAVEMNVLVAGDGRYSFRHALLGEAVYDDLLPGERVRLHAAYAAALADGPRRPGPPPSWPGTPGSPTTSTPPSTASIRAGDEAAAVGGPDEAAQHYQQALELLADPAPAADARRATVSKLAVSAAEALSDQRPARRGPPSCSPSSSTSCPPTPRPTRRARLLSARADALIVIEPDEDPLAVSAAGRRPAARTAASGLRAQVLATHARILLGYGRYDEAQAVGLDALALAERLDLPRAGRRGDHHAERAEEGRAQGGPAQRAGRGGRPGRADRRRARRAARPASSWAAPTRTGPSSPRPSAGSAARMDAARRGRHSRGRRTASRPAGSWPGCCYVRRRLGRGPRADRRQPASTPPPIAARAARERAAAGARRPRRAGRRPGPGAAQVLGARGLVAIHSAEVAEVGEAARADDPHAVARRRTTTSSPCSAGSGTSGSAPGSGWRPTDGGRRRRPDAAAQRAERAAYLERGRAAARRRAHGAASGTPTRRVTGDPRAGPG